MAARAPKRGVVALALVVAACAATAAHVEPGPAPAPEDVRWIQRALDGWERASRDLLGLDPEPLPWIVLFDTTHAWHLAADPERLAGAAVVPSPWTFAGRTVPLHVLPVEDSVALPNGARIPVAGTAFASLCDEGRRPFFVLALLEVWRREPGAGAEPRLAEILLGVVSHEIVHTRQLVDVGRRVAGLRARHALPENLDDDVIEERFGERPGFREAYERESALFYQAASEGDPERRADLVRAALAVAAERRARWFAGEKRVWADVEDLFLDMEGVAVWTSWRLAHPETIPAAGTLAAERAHNTWSQDEGLALFLLVDALVPDWRARVLGPELAAPFALLAEAVGAERP